MTTCHDLWDWRAQESIVQGLHDRAALVTGLEPGECTRSRDLCLLSRCVD